mmetsp:Transcript_2352/g.3694  ORF Transcript_2352/g.3694 Transcript_2352/m.3694 type:complete len:201 (+) Transcript_2352:1872-2474(+)
MSASLLQGLILGAGSFEVALRQGTGVTKLHFKGKDGSAGSNAPCNQWFVDATALDSLTDFILIDATDFPQQYEHMHGRIVVIAQQMIDKSGSWVSITSNSDTFVDTIRISADDIIQFVTHTTRLGNVCHGTWSVELGHDNVIEHTSGISDTETTWFDTTHGGWTNDSNALVVCLLVELTSLGLRNTFGNNGNSFDLVRKL